MKFKGSSEFNNYSPPNPPLLSSHPVGWGELQLAFFRAPAFYVPDHVPEFHTICVNTGNAITIDRKVDGQSQTIDAIPTDDIGFYPANLRQSFQTEQEGEAIMLYLQPSLLERTQIEMGFKDGIALVPKLAPGGDPLVYHMAIALKTALTKDGTASKLYADTMANALAIVSAYQLFDPPLSYCTTRCGWSF